MRIIYPTLSNRQFYERNMITRVLTYSAPGIAPHVETTRITYTVPAGKRAVVTGVYLWTLRSAAAAVLGGVHVFANVNINAVAARIAKAFIADNTVNSFSLEQPQRDVWLFAADTFSISTFDSSNGGTMEYNVSFYYNEFDI